MVESQVRNYLQRDEARLLHDDHPLPYSDSAVPESSYYLRSIHESPRLRRAQRLHVGPRGPDLSQDWYVRVQLGQLQDANKREIDCAQEGQEVSFYCPLPSCSS